MSRLEEALNRASQQRERVAEPAQPDALPAPESEPAATQTAAAPSSWQFETVAAAPAAPAEMAPQTAQPEAPAAPAMLTQPSAEGNGPAGSNDGWRTFIFGVVASHKVVVEKDIDTSLVEQYRRLAAVLHHAQLERGIRTVMITSAVASEGKTLTSTNLALTLSHSYRRRVLLIDADLRRPTVHEVFRVANESGLGDVLANPELRHLPLIQLSPHLWVLTAGKPDPDPMSGLVSEQMKSLIAEAADQFDWVVVDTPPIALLSDANLLAAFIDSALLVVGANQTPYPLVQRAIEAIGADRVLGVVLNRIDKAEMVGGYGYYDNYGYGYGYGYGTRSRDSRRRNTAPSESKPLAAVPDAS